MPSIAYRLLSAFAMVVFTIGIARGDDLRGVVRDEAGNPLANATVSISTAGPKVGTATFCPSCYADCAKRATTAADGSYLIKDLDPTLKFTVLAVMKDRPPAFTKGVDPSAKSLDIVLKARAKGIPESQLLKLRVKNATGAPVAGAMIDLDSFSDGVQGGSGSTASEFSEVIAVSDETGLITIATFKDKVWLGGTLSARGYATRPIELGDTSLNRRRAVAFNPATGAFEAVGTKTDSAAPSEAVLGYGATVRGSVERDGKPVAGVAVQLCDLDKAAGEFMGWFDIATDDAGRFEFVNVPVGRKWEAYVTMSPAGVSTRSAVSETREGESISAGILQQIDGVRVEGHLTLSDGKPIPAGTRLALSRDSTWDGLSVDLPADGHFEFVSVPAGELIQLSARVKGYLVDESIVPSASAMRMGFLGLADESCTGLRLRLTPGERFVWPTDDGVQQAMWAHLKEQESSPLRGATK